MKNTYIEYIKNADSLTLETMNNMLYEILEEIKDDEDAEELFDELLEKAIQYTMIRAKWNLMSVSEKNEMDESRTMTHDSLIIKFNQLAKYLKMNEKTTEWRDKLGYEAADRKRIGDFANYLVFIFSLSAR